MPGDNIEDGDRADHADRDGGAAAVCDPRGRPHGGCRRRHEDHEIMLMPIRMRHEWPALPNPHSASRGPMAGRIRIRLKAFDHALIDQAAADIVRTGREDRRAGVGADSAADQAAAVDGAAQPAHRQEEPRAVRAEDAQAADRHSRLPFADGRRADQARSAGGRGRRNQSQ